MFYSDATAITELKCDFGHDNCFSCEQDEFYDSLNGHLSLAQQTNAYAFTSSRSLCVVVQKTRVQSSTVYTTQYIERTD